MTLGPVQLLVIAFDGVHFTGAIRAEAERLTASETIRVLDSVFVSKADDGSMRTLEGGEGDGRLLLRLLEGGPVDASEADAATEAELVDAAASIPPGTAAAMILIEHRWAIPLRTAVNEAGGRTVAETWIDEGDLAAVGLA